MRIIHALWLISCLCWSSMVVAQTIQPIPTPKTDSVAPKKYAHRYSTLIIDVAYGMQTPLGDMAKIYRTNFNVNGRINYITRNHLILSVGGDFIFNDILRRDLVVNLRESSGYIIDKQGALADVKQGLRGFYVNAGIGKFWNLSKSRRRRMGFECRVTGGYFQHWARIKVDGEDLVQLMGEYNKGYDRKSSGVAFQQYIGFRVMSANRLTNLFIGIDALEGITYNRRAWNYDERKADTSAKFDVLLGFRAGFSIPFPIYNYRKETDADLKFY